MVQDSCQYSYATQTKLWRGPNSQFMQYRSAAKHPQLTASSLKRTPSLNLAALHNRSLYSTRFCFSFPLSIWTQWANKRLKHPTCKQLKEYEKQDRIHHLRSQNTIKNARDDMLRGKPECNKAKKNRVEKRKNNPIIPEEKKSTTGPLSTRRKHRTRQLLVNPWHSVFIFFRIWMILQWKPGK